MTEAAGVGLKRRRGLACPMIRGIKQKSIAFLFLQLSCNEFVTKLFTVLLYYRRMTKYTRATTDDITRIWKQLWGDLTPEQVREITKKEDEMYNGWTPSTPIKTRVMNLVEQIPTEYRNRAVAECVSENPHDFERALTGYVLSRIWETYDHPVNEAEFTDGFSDPRSEDEKAADAYWQDEQATRADIRAGFQQW